MVTEGQGSKGRALNTRNKPGNPFSSAWDLFLDLGKDYRIRGLLIGFIHGSAYGDWLGLIAVAF
jgi:hypothetical protein